MGCLPVSRAADNTFTITGVGAVVSGTLMRGLVKVNQNLLIGPDEFGKFQPVQIKVCRRRTFFALLIDWCLSCSSLTVFRCRAFTRTVCPSSSSALANQHRLR